MLVNAIKKIRYEYILYMLIGITGGLAVVFNPAFLVVFIALAFFCFATWRWPFFTFIGLGVFLLIQESITRSYPAFLLLKRGDEALVVIMVLIFFLKKIMDRERIDYTPLALPLVIFIAWGMASALINKVPWQPALLTLYIFAKGFLLFFYVSNLKIEEKEINFFTKFFLRLFILFALIGLAQITLGRFVPIPLVPRYGGLQAATSIFGHHGFYGSIMGIGLAITLSLAWTRGLNRYFISMLIIGSGLISSTVRKTIVGLGVAIATTGIIFNKKYLSKAFVYLLIATFFFLAAFLPSAKKQVKEVSSVYVDMWGYGPRTQFYTGAETILLQSPIFGAGPGRFGSIASMIYKSPLYKKLNIDDTKFTMDTFWPQLIGETGLGGFILFSWLLGLFFAIAYKGYKVFSENGQLSFLPVAAMLILILSIVESFVSPTYNYSAYAYFFFAIFGLVYVGTSRIKVVKELK